MGLFLLSCAGSVPEPSENHVAYSRRHGFPASLEGLREGRRLYVVKCDGCHFLPRLKDHAPESWPGWMDSMRVEVELSPAQDSLILAYLKAASGHLRDSQSGAISQMHKEDQ